MSRTLKETKPAELKRFWFVFDSSAPDNHPVGISIGCGVTAYSTDDALSLISKHVFEDSQLPPITQMIENVDISTLDKNHVLPNVGITLSRGIWFPQGYG